MQMLSHSCRILAVALILLLAVASSLQAGDCQLPPFGTDGFWVSSFGADEILRFDQDANYLGSFSGPTLNGPRGITVTPSGMVYVASQLSDEILVFDRDGNYSHSFTAPGLDGPTGGSFSPAGDYYVCSFNSDTVFRFDADENTGQIADQFLGQLPVDDHCWPAIRCVALVEQTPLDESYSHGLEIAGRHRDATW